MWLVPTPATHLVRQHLSGGGDEQRRDVGADEAEGLREALPEPREVRVVFPVLRLQWSATARIDHSPRSQPLR